MTNERIVTDCSDAGRAGETLQEICHELAAAAGWWTDLATMRPFTTEQRWKLVPEKLLLIHAEVSEACEAHRKNLMDDKLPARTGLEVELADAVIRIMDLGGALGLDVGGAIRAKLLYNATRSDHKLVNRLAEGGKRY